MCVNCVTSAEAVAPGVAGATAAGNELRRIVFDALRGRTAHERRRETWHANAAFIASLGLDPQEVLGPPPRPEPAPRAVASMGGEAVLALV